MLTETAGTLQSCLRRATSLSKDEIRTVVDCIDSVVHILNSSRVLACRAIELYIIKELEQRSHTSTSATGNDGPVDPVDPLDLLLSKKYGRSIVRNVVTLELVMSREIPKAGQQSQLLKRLFLD
ncbi:hypothetical protein BGZ65_012400 [Modicella reniformis]|uniref:Uncharacterized protein n=1 Tax=Modicella reniformis TaxID=1440133 RepID=A0A9P6MCY2_9FUNG|nr:hypothetical protein BGZ65_012400 [Modicella reniformis]